MKQGKIYLLIAVALILVSWGVKGHRSIATIAERHLTPEAAANVKALLGNESLAEVSTWADDEIATPEYKQTASWHYINLPQGLTFDKFKSEVAAQRAYNVYSALLEFERELKDKTTPIEKKQIALKFIVHFVGDMHQPMHVSGKADRGGNTIPEEFDGRETNLHSLWDSKLLEHEHLSNSQFINTCDQATPAQIKQWQNDAPMQWIWESYQISTQLYADTKPGSNLGEDYYRAHIAIVNKRIEQAGIRLAGVLNQIFSKNGTLVSNQTYPHPAATGIAGYATVKLADVATHIGQNVSVTGPVEGYKQLGNMLLINIGAPYPDNPLTVVFRGAAKALGEPLKTKGKNIRITGTLINFKGKPEIEITSASQISDR